MRVLVTGATGFIGRHTVRVAQEAGHEVACLVRKDPGDLPKTRIALGDLSDAGSLDRALEDIDAVVHLASLLKVPWKPEFRTVNIGGTEALARAASQKSKPPILVVVSTLAVAGPASPGRPHDEKSEPRPISRYGRMKLDAERAATAFASKVPITIVRPPMVVGEGDKYGAKLFSSVERGIHVVPSFAENQISLIHVEDLANVLIRAIDRGERVQTISGSGVYYVADEKQPTYAELGRMVGRALGGKLPAVIKIPGPMSWLAALAGELLARIKDQPTIFNLDKWREATAGSWICDSSKARRELSFSPKPIEERLAQTAAWYRSM